MASKHGLCREGCGGVDSSSTDLVKMLPLMLEPWVVTRVRVLPWPPVD